MQQFQQPYPNQPLYANPQFHQMMPQTTDANLPVPGQPQMSQANQLATIAQSMPQLANFAMSQSTAAGTPPATQSMTQNVRSNQQMQMTPMMLQQLHQMRMPVQPGMHQMLPLNGPGQNIPQQNGTLPKNMPNQQQPNSMMPQMPMGQQMPQQMINPNNPMMNMHLQNMRMPMMQGNNPQIQGFMSLPNNTQAPSMQQAMTVPVQMSLQGPMMQGQMPGHNIPTSMPAQGQPQSQGQMPQQPQMQQPQSMPQQPQSMSQQPQQMNQQPQQMAQQPQQITQQPQQMTQQAQQMSQQPQSMSQQPQQMNQPQQMSQQPQNQMAPGQPMPGQPMQQPGHMMMQPPHGNMQMPQGPQGQNMNQPMHQGPGNPGQSQLPQQMMQGPMNSQIQGQMQQNQGQPGIAQGPVQGQAMIPPNNFQGPHPMVNQQTQQPQTPVKSENNNNTAELISFD